MNVTTSAGDDRGTIFAQFRSPEGEALGPQLEVPLNLSPKQLNGVLNELLSNEKTDPYSFYVNDEVGPFIFFSTLSNVCKYVDVVCVRMPGLRNLRRSTRVVLNEVMTR